MSFSKIGLMAAVVLGGVGSLAAAQAPAVPSFFKDFPPPQVIDDVPAALAQRLVLGKLPKPAGKPVVLFDGRDLAAFTPWLGYPGGGLQPAGPDDQPIGQAGIGDVFKVVEVDGGPAIRVSGRIWGAITTRREYENYHLSLSFKFARDHKPGVLPNSGVLYHSYGPAGAFAGTWMSAIEFEVAEGMTGMMLPVGRELGASVEIGTYPGKSMFGGGPYRYMRGGKLAALRMPTMVDSATKPERPVGEWNRLDLYVAGDRAVHVVNGVPVMALSNLTLKGPDGAVRPLTRGRIQLQSEGAEIFFRDIRIVPIRTVPEVFAK
ncbi:DUF1080 domain-containing protein [Novosphingobium sp. BL-52-GroH]|uniref:3-keto-disaccharide hydrolase n=1 Tax=Novosphingobium sp. BL-52-GroH TaxID=3349877 RepID=UPI0038504360